MQLWDDDGDFLQIEVRPRQNAITAQIVQKYAIQVGQHQPLETGGGEQVEVRLRQNAKTAVTAITAHGICVKNGPAAAAELHLALLCHMPLDCICCNRQSETRFAVSTSNGGSSSSIKGRSCMTVLGKSTQSRCPAISNREEEAGWEATAGAMIGAATAAVEADARKGLVLIASVAGHHLKWSMIRGEQMEQQQHERHYAMICHRIKCIGPKPQTVMKT